MRLTRIAGNCQDGYSCPTIYRTDRGTLVVQGYRPASAELADIDLPDSESAVEIPVTVMEEAARALSR